jgi:hypothetical protein
VTLAQAREAAARIDEGLATIAAARGLRLQHLREDWYGFDPIHLRPSQWQAAWLEILTGGDSQPVEGRPSRWEWARLYLMRPEHRWLFGREQRMPQRGTVLPGGGIVRLY